MSRSVRTFWLPRRGNSPAEYEDASAVDASAGRMAVADGATESCFARLWAGLLVEGFVESRDCPPQQWPAPLPALQQRWEADVSARKLRWAASRLVKRGDFAAFLGLALPVSCDADCRWQAVAVGDTCLLHTRGPTLLRAFPLEHSRQFDNVPVLVGSRMSTEEVCKRQSLWLDGRGQPGDRLWIMTDALAQWCLAEHEAGRNPWSELESLLTPPECSDRFASWIEGLRDARGLHNDDVTLVAVEFQGLAEE
jgi:hypothetical protein